MSHFTVMVIGDAIQAQLAPYDENKEVPEYKNSDGEPSTYNPDSKWDWYQIGGRWTGFFKLKPGALGVRGEPGLMTIPCQDGYADSAKIRDIDFEFMMKAEASAAAAAYDKLEAALEGAKLSDLPIFEDLLLKYGRENIEDARTEYWGNPTIKRLSDAGVMPFTRTAQEVYGPDRATYITRRSIGSYIPYALLHEGRWVARGEMGWFGFSDDKESTERWTQKVDEFLKTLPDDTTLTIVDCHI